MDLSTSRGKLVIKPQFDYVYPFTDDGVAHVLIGDFETGKWSFIDKNGNYAAEPQVEKAEALTSAVPIRTSSERGYKYLDEHGETLFELDMPYAEDFNEHGVAKAGYHWYDCHVGEERKPIYHYINTKGEIIRPE